MKNSYEEYASVLNQVDFLSELDRITITKLAAYLEPVTLHEGKTLFNQGDPGDALYIVTKGQLGVYVHSEKMASFRIKSIYPGEYVGEMALLTQSQRTATIKADVTSELLRLNRSKFIELVKQEPSVALSIASTVSVRLTEVLSTTQLKQEIRTQKKKTKLRNIHTEAIPLGLTKMHSWFSSPLALTIMTSIIMFIIGWIIPPPGNMPLAGWKLIATLLGFIIALNFNALPDAILSILLMTSWALGGVVTPNVALEGFATPGWLLILCTMLVAVSIASSGLLYRFALWMVAKCKGDYTLSILGLTIAGIVISPTIPSATSRMLFISPIVTDLVDALGYKPRSNEAAGIAMASLVSFGLMVSMFLTNSTTALLVYSLLPKENLTWLNWAFIGLPINLVMLFGLLGTVFYFYRPEEKRLSSDIKLDSLTLQRTILGPITRKEWWSIFVSISLMIGFITTHMHGIQPTWIATIALAILAANKVVTVDTLKSVNWNYVLIFGLLFSLEGVFAATGLEHWISTMISQHIGTTHPNHILFLMIVTFFCFGISFIVHWQAAAPLITVSLIPVSLAIGVAPVIVGMISIIACNTFFMPHQSTVYLALSHGTHQHLFTDKQARPLAYAYALFTVLGVLVSVPFWYSFGLLK